MLNVIFDKVCYGLIVFGSEGVKSEGVLVLFEESFLKDCLETKGIVG